MPIQTQTVVVATCDACGGKIDTDQRYVDACVYGVAFHENCWKAENGPRFARLLGLDDIHYYRAGDRLERLERAWAER